MFNNYVVSQRERERNTQDMYTVESQIDGRETAAYNGLKC